MQKHFLLIIACLFFGLCCKDEPTKPTIIENPLLSIFIEEIGTKEVWLKFHIGEINLPAKISLFRNGEYLNSWTVTIHDTIVIDYNNIVPGQTYEYKLNYLEGETILLSSDPTNIRTLDSTNHEIFWQIDSIGQFGSDIYGLWGSDPNNVYAVGTFYEAIGHANLAHWDGKKWALVKTEAIDGIEGIQAGYIDDIFGISAQNIWVVGHAYGYYGYGKDTIWGFVAEWNGIEWRNISPSLQTSMFTSIWASSENDVWVGGTNGSLHHYNGKDWQLINSGTKYFIEDIWGTSKDNIFIAAWNGCCGNGNVTRYNGSVWKQESGLLAEMSNSSYFYSVWGCSSRFIYIISNEWIIENSRGYWYRKQEQLKVPYWKIRGTNRNDLFICGLYGALAHWNGSTWKSYGQQFSGSSNWYLTSIQAFSNDVFIGGFGNGAGIILRGKR